MSLARRNQRKSGWRRLMPDALHGASTKMASKGLPSHQAPLRRASPTLSSARRFKRVSVSCTRSSRVASLSNATRSSSPSSSRCAVLPPGAAQASNTRALAGKPVPHNRGAARWADASCTDTSPCAQPGNANTLQGLCSWMAWPSKAASFSKVAPWPSAARRSRYWAPVARRAFTRSVMGGCSLACLSRACHCCGQSCLNFSIHQSGWLKTATGDALAPATKAGRSRKKRRNTAFMKLAAAGTRTRMAFTAWSTKVWSG